MKVGPSGFGDQVADAKPPRAALVKSHGGERCGNVETMIPAGTVERGERKRTVDAKGKGPSGPNRKAESTDAPERGGLLRSSEETAVMVVERRRRVIGDESVQLATGGARSSTEGGSLQSMARAG
jgi:hypothetical protein